MVGPIGQNQVFAGFNPVERHQKVMRAGANLWWHIKRKGIGDNLKDDSD